jgi:hypothetical protein
MAQRSVHYEAAFEDFIRSRGWPYIPVDEQKKAIFAGARIKSFDFLVHPPRRRPWLCDVKGRKFPYHTRGGRRYWENWVTREDLEGLRRWREVFGESYEPAIVFVYWLLAPPERETFTETHTFRNRQYAFLFVSASDYEAHARVRSPSWDTVSVPLRTFRELVSPIAADEAVSTAAAAS